MKRKILLIVVTLVALGVGMFAFLKKSPAVSAELSEELTSVPLKSVGTSPPWLSGTLIRNGPVYVTVNGQTNPHWFDGLAMLHAFRFHEGQVDYTNAFLRTDDYKTVFEKGSLDYAGFATDPCRSLFKRFLTQFIPHTEPKLHNANVNVAKLSQAYVALTEVPLPVRFDPQTLKTLGVLDYHDQLPHEKCWESAHPHYDSACQENINYLIEYGRMSTYTLYRLKDGASAREIIARVPSKEPAYMHSFALTPHYVIFTEFPFVVRPLDLLTKNQAFIKNFSWKPERGTRFVVVNRSTGEVVGSYKTGPFFAFHHANAFEKDDLIYLDLICYDDVRVISDVATNFKPDSQVSSQSEPLQSLRRFTLSLKTGDLSSETILKRPIEFPRINDRFDGHPYRFLYLTDPRSPAHHGAPARPLYKIDLETRKIDQWSEEGCYPGEPVFVAAPDAQKEDEGVILAVILDLKHHTSFLLILDGATFQEIGRSQAPHAIPTGLHGQYFPAPT